MKFTKTVYGTLAGLALAASLGIMGVKRYRTYTETLTSTEPLGSEI